MSFLKANPFSGIGAAMNPSGAAEGIGKLLNVSPFGVSRFADTVGKVANGFASAGGAEDGYDGQAAPTNWLQNLNPGSLQEIERMFAGRQPAGGAPPSAYGNGRLY